MAIPVKDRKPAALPAPNSDFYELLETLPAEDLAVLKQVRTFMETKIAPIITKYWVEDAFPFEILPALKELNIGGVAMQGYGCRGGSAQLFGLIAMEMARFDSSIATFFGVHNGFGDGLDLLGRLRRTKAEMAATDGTMGKNWLLRTNRTANWLRRCRWAVDDREATRRHVDPEWSEEVDRQLPVV